jgi:hypothetical protein
MANHSIVMNSSTFLPGGDEPDSQVQITTTDEGTAFISISLPNEPNTYVRIEAREWDRYKLSL